MKQFQKDLPTAKASTLHETPQTVHLYRSDVFLLQGSNFQTLIYAEWGEECKNRWNVFHLYKYLVIPGTEMQSERYSYDEAPETYQPRDFDYLKKYHGCYSAGPWYYIENTVFLASERDCWGLLKGETRQVIRKDGTPCWKLEGIPKIQQIASPECPTDMPELHWAPQNRTGEGKVADLDSARRSAIWPEATAEQLQDKKALEERLPALLAEFKLEIEKLGFIW